MTQELLPKQGDGFCVDGKVSGISPHCQAVSDGFLVVSQRHLAMNEWTDFDQLPALKRAKILAVKVLNNRPLFHPSRKEVQSHLRRMCSVVRHDGVLSADSKEQYVTASPSLLCPHPLVGHHRRDRLWERLRLTAVTALLKLAASPTWEEEIQNFAFEKIAFTTQVSPAYPWSESYRACSCPSASQDCNFDVRQGFLMKLRKYLTRRLHHPRWNAIPSLYACDVSENLGGLVVSSQNMPV